MNGDKAGYAVVIAPYHLVQAKYTVDNSKTQDLDIQTKMNKMGLTNSSKHLLNQFLTDVIYAKM